MSESTTGAGTREHARDIRNAHGAPGWFELVTADLAGAAEVLSRLFGWQLEPLDSSETGTDYLVAKVGGREVGGVRQPMPGEPEETRWVTYVTVDDAEAFARHAREAGVNVEVPPVDLGAAGRMTVVAAPAIAQVFAFQYNRPFA